MDFQRWRDWPRPAFPSRVGKVGTTTTTKRKKTGKFFVIKRH